MHQEINFELNKPHSSNNDNIERLQKLLKPFGIQATLSSDETYLCISYDDKVVKQKASRNAGKKQCRLNRKISLRETERWIAAVNAETVARQLGISRATLFRKLKKARNNNELFLS